ncbi:PDZ domain-containing protein [Pseudomarimonas salicorniae]|uniref:PDZ domain-containing protein n=1 Tax=Pseudomarimonas salicorniae TaxID=2933270 RepID=A0ABT0GIY2_9GAMM|nr:PDZ domain-containing protein [Lysobacter sp. CAU 1642]MCK7594511.1 PDZ domain-containing protein [Lysobacter sp. CAU 1642]
MNASFRSERSLPARPPRRPLALLLALFAPAAFAQAPVSAPELVDEAVIAIHHARGAEDRPLTIEQPARVRYELGAVIDSQPEDGGLPRVMAVTPRRAADRMGLMEGDRLLSLGDTRFDSVADPGALLREAVAGGHGMLRFEVLRDGRTRQVSGHLDRIDIPGYRLQIDAPAAVEGCGRVSTFLTPPISEDLFPALLHEIDGRLYGSLDSEVFRLPAGRHVLKVTEMIRGDRFLGQQNRQRQRLMRNERFKYLEIDVKPNTKYHLGVRFFPDRRNPIRDQKYWEPVIWKETEEPCR